MATVTPNFNWPVPTSTDLVKDGATAIEALGDSIDGSLVDLKGGTTGQVLSKTSGTDMDFTWVTTDDANAIQNSIVDAKGDLISATANDTPARLAVGNNGETLVADSSTSTGLRYNPQNALVNPVINGGFDIAQRGTSVSIGASANGYTLDRWFYGTGANQASTISQQATGDTTNLPNIQSCVRVQRNSGQTGAGATGFDTSLETRNSIPYAGKTVTISFYARAGALYSPTSSVLNMQLVTGTGTDQSVSFGYTGSSIIISQNSTLTTTWQRFAYTATIGATATELGVRFVSTWVGTAGATDYYEVTGVQIDLGTYTATTAPTFRRSGGTIQGELAACQRYYFRTVQGTTGGTFAGFGRAYNTTLVENFVALPVPMRVYPTSMDYSNLQQNNSATNYTTGTWTLRSFGQTTLPYVEYLHGSAVFTAGNMYNLGIGNGYIGFSAEL
jgi:hypothetical protein